MKTIKADISDRAGLLSRSVLFSALTQPQQIKLARFCMLRQYAKEENLFTQDSRAEGFFLIISGKVRVFRTSDDGREQNLHFFGESEMVGEVPVFKGGRYPAGAQCVTTSRLLYVPGGDFLDFSQDNPQVLLEMLAVLSARLRKFVEMVDDLSLKEVSARLAKHIIDLSVQAANKRVTLSHSKADLAARLGTIPATLSRTLKKMKQKGIIDVNGGEISIKDDPGIRKLASGVKINDIKHPPS